MPKIARLIALAPLVLVLAAGCTKGNRNANATVSGKVTYNGKPVTGGELTFHAEGFGVTSGVLKPDGSYVGTDLAVGTEVTVTIDTEKLNSDKKMPTYGAGGAGAGTGGPGGPNVGGKPVRPASAETPVGSGGSEVYVKIPSKYADKKTSTLKKTFSGGKQTWDLELTD